MTITLAISERNRTMQDTVKSESSKREVLYSQIMDALETMPERLREVFVLTHYEGMSEEAIASKIGIKQPDLESIVWEANSAFEHALKSSQTS